ncbi:creatininase family protein [Gaoshiqia sp. Z1-71]|uniref:creatininase family protein n=1 Tax=Gaoshiqia hydrogeniformans TaxID=3290090 RepID=UPI003BF8A2D8
MKSPKLAESCWKTIKDQRVELVVLPWGATEAHNYHLPYATDNYQIEAISAEAAQEANKQGAQVIVLPAVPFGVNTGQSDIKLTINLNPSTQARILHDVADSLNRQGFRKLLIINGHGGNDFNQMVRELNLEFPDLFICVSHWFKMPGRENFFTQPGDHADETETSLMLHLKPELVLPLDEAGEGHSKKFRVKALNQNWAWAERQWTQVTTDTGIGNPKLATREKGRRFFEYLVKQYSEFMLELSNLNLKEIYE